MYPQLSNCVNYFSRTILNDLSSGVWIAGGAVRDYFTFGFPKSDIDVFFPSEELFLQTKTFFKESRVLFENSNVLKLLHKNKKIDLVKKFFPNPEECIKNFDFTVCSVAVDKTQVYYHPTFFIDLARKSLVINSLPYPLSTLSRLQKYIQKGFHICNQGLLQIVTSLPDLKSEDQEPEDLEFYPDGTPKFRGID